MKLFNPIFLQLVTLCGLTYTNVNGAVKFTVKEDSDVVLPCSLSSKENIESKLFDWRKDQNMEVFMYDGGHTYGNGLTGQDKQFEGRVSHFPHELKNGNASIKINKTQVSDSGTYTCIFPRLQPSQTFSVQLVVECVLRDRTAEHIQGACPKPSVRALDVTEDQVELQCIVRGASRKPVVEWRDSSRNILPAEEPQVTERGGRYDIILQTTLNKTDLYSCVVTQEEICHQVDDSVFVNICAPASDRGLSAGLVTANVITAVLLFLVMGVCHFKQRKKYQKKSNEIIMDHNQHLRNENNQMAEDVM